MKKSILLFIAITFVVIANSQNSNEKQKILQKQETIIHPTPEQFRLEVLNYKAEQKDWKFLGQKPAIVDFYATWCGPCNKLSPELEKIAKEYNGQLTIYKIDIDKHRGIAEAFGVTSIPLLIFFPVNRQAYSSMGYMSFDQLKNTVTEYLLNKE